MPEATGIAVQNTVFDGWTSLVGGVDAGREANLIDDNQAAGLENIVCRGGNPQTRPAIVEREADVTSEHFFNPDGTYDAQSPPNPDSISSETAFTTGLFQGAGYYATESLQCLIASIGGRIFKVIPTNMGCTVEEIVVTSSGGLTEFGGLIDLSRQNRGNIPIAYMCQVGKFFVIQDGEASPIIIDSGTARRALAQEVPTGKEMAYGMGRLVVVLNSGEIVFGDIVNGKGNGDIDALGFTETLFLPEGGTSKLQPSMGRPTALIFYPQQDTALGQGELIVWGERGAGSFFLSIPRLQWKDSSFQRDALLDTGNRGHRNPTNVNEDTWFRAQDGWRSYRQARAEVNQWTQIPLSTPVRDFVDAETPWLLEYGSAIHFENRLICTATPIPNQGKLYHDGFVVLDFDILSAFGKNMEPAWDGHWYGEELKVLQLVSGIFNWEERAFCFALNEDGENTLFEISKRDIDDSSGPIPWEIVNRRMDCKTPTSEKLLSGGDLWVSDVVSNDGVLISVDYRSDERDEWTAWHSFQAIPQNGTVGAFNDGHPTARPGYAPRKRLPTPANGCDTQTKRQLRRGFEFQQRIKGTGHCRIRKFRMHARELLENAKGACE